MIASAFASANGSAVPVVADPLLVRMARDLVLKASSSSSSTVGILGAGVPYPATDPNGGTVGAAAAGFPYPTTEPPDLGSATKKSTPPNKPPGKKHGPHEPANTGPSFTNPNVLHVP